MIILNVDARLGKEELPNLVFNQNDFADECFTPESFKDAFIPVFKTGPRDKLWVHWVAEVTPRIRNLIEKKGKIYIGFSVSNKWRNKYRRNTSY